MPEVTKLREEITDIRDALLKAIVKSTDRAELGKVNRKKSEELDKELAILSVKRANLANAVNHTNRIYKNIEEYLNEKKKNSLEMLQLAVEKAGNIVPDADVNGIALKLKEKEAKIINRLGQDINLREGSAYRTVMGMLLRYTLLKFQPDKIQAIFLDEAFATLSDETATLMREFIDAFKEDILIVGIEQRSVMYEGIERKSYRVAKGADKVTVLKEI